MSRGRTIIRMSRSSTSFRARSISISGSTVTRLGAGGLLVVPPNARHWGVVVGDEPVFNLDVFTPKRAEYAA